jgi:two-component system sensor histidine kinase QseC
MLRRTALLVSAGIALVWVCVLALLYLQIGHEADELQYGQLNDSGRLLLTYVGTTTPAVLTANIPPQVSHTKLAFTIYDGNGRMLGSSHLPVLSLPPAGVRSDWFKQEVGGRTWRCALYAQGDKKIVVGQPTRLRNELADEITGDLLLPVAALLLVLLPLSIGALWFGFRPLLQFERELALRAPDNLAPIATALPAELAPIAQRINTLLGRMARTLDKERRFTGDAAHELRTPIAALQVQLEVARTSPRPDARERAQGKMQEGLERLNRLVVQLLALARVDDMSRAPLSEVDLPALLRNALARAQLDGTVETRQQVPWYAAPDLLDLVLRNLFENALRYGGSAPRVEVVVDANRITIRDFGPGIAPQWLERAGERFARMPGQQQGGSGLGMSIVLRAAEAMDAHVTWKNAEGGGLQVDIVLPAPPTGG